VSLRARRGPSSSRVTAPRTRHEARAGDFHSGSRLASTLRLAPRSLDALGPRVRVASVERCGWSLPAGSLRDCSIVPISHLRACSIVAQLVQDERARQPYGRVVHERIVWQEGIEHERDAFLLR
jgi:hypothetical protein